MSRKHVTTLLLGCVCTSLGAVTPRIGVLDLGLGAGKSEFGWTSDPTVFESSLSTIGTVTRLSGEEVSKPKALTRENFDLLVVPTGAAWPMAAADNLVNYLRSGGSLLTCGGYAFDIPVVREGDRWKAFSLPAVTLSHPQPLLLPPAEKWWKSAPLKASVETAPAERGVTVASKRFHLWATAQCNLDATGLKGCSALSFSAAASGSAVKATIELIEKDGSRWQWHFAVSPERREYTVSEADFTYWHDSRAVNRGGDGDHVHFDRVRTLAVGCSPCEAQENTAMAVTFTDFHKGIDEKIALRRTSKPQINTRTARIRDAIHPKPTQVNAFDPSFELRNAAKIATASEVAGILPKVSVKGSFRGLAAIAQLGVGGHGYDSNRCAWRPFLEATAADGSDRGPAAAFVYHHSDTFAGSFWAIFGVDNADLFENGSPVTEKMLAMVAGRLIRRVALNETTTSFACFRRGETARLNTCVANFGREALAGKVRFSLKDEAGRSIAQIETPFTAKPGTNMCVTADWPVGKTAPDYIPFTAELVLNDGSIYDREPGAFVVWDGSVIAKGPKIGRKGALMTIDGQAFFGMGAQTYWGQTRPTVARSPRSFHRDFAQMRAANLRWTRLFLPWVTEADKRISDACVQLAQKHGLVIYHTQQYAPCMAEGEELAAQNRLFREIAERYHDVPGFIIDIRNEPVMKLVPSWESARRMRHWLTTDRAAAREGRKDVLVSVGWSQGWAGGKTSKDPAWCSLDLDFTDRHYYGPPEQMFRDLKDVDMRAIGKPMILAECGAKCHPTFVSEDPWHMGDTDEQYSARFRSLTTHAFALGASALLGWHWRDPMEGIFPCGLVHATGVKRPTAFVFEKMARVYGGLPLRENTPEVVIRLAETPRMSDDEQVRKNALERAYAVDAALLYWGANWSKVTESALAECKAKLILDPEALPTSNALALRKAVGEMLVQNGCFFTRRPSDPETLETFRVPGEKAEGWVFWNGGRETLSVERFGEKFTLEPTHAGYLQLDTAGKVVVKETL